MQSIGKIFADGASLTGWGSSGWFTLGDFVSARRLCVSVGPGRSGQTGGYELQVLARPEESGVLGGQDGGK